jgi:hypothetical protein
MSEHFITNSGDKSLSTVINGIMPKTNALDFLVGYFYFSGIKEIYEHIAEKKIRILVGLEMDSELHNKTVEMDFLSRKTRSSKEETRETYYKSFVKLFNESDHFEKNETYRAFKIYYEKNQKRHA